MLTFKIRNNNSPDIHLTIADVEGVEDLVDQTANSISGGTFHYGLTRYFNDQLVNRSSERYSRYSWIPSISPVAPWSGSPNDFSGYGYTNFPRGLYNTYSGMFRGSLI